MIFLIPVAIISFLLLRHQILLHDKHKCWSEMIKRTIHPNLYAKEILSKLGEPLEEAILLNILTHHQQERPLWHSIFSPLNKQNRNIIKKHLRDNYFHPFYTKLLYNLKKEIYKDS